MEKHDSEDFMTRETHNTIGRGTSIDRLIQSDSVLARTVGTLGHFTLATAVAIFESTEKFMKKGHN